MVSTTSTSAALALGQDRLARISQARRAILYGDPTGRAAPMLDNRIAESWRPLPVAGPPAR